MARFHIFHIKKPIMDTMSEAIIILSTEEILKGKKGENLSQEPSKQTVNDVEVKIDNPTSDRNAKSEWFHSTWKRQS